MKTILLVLSLCLCYVTNATTYYFSNSGDDSRSSSQASNQSTPWRSINKLNSIFSTLQPGDFVLFKRGDVFYGSIKVTKSGNSAAPITIGAYGSGPNPVITGFNTVSNWINIGGGIWESSNTVSSLNAVNMVTINGVQYAKGRFPNANTTNKGYLTIDSHAGSNSITDTKLPPSPNWTGAAIVIRTNHWVLDTCTITSHSGQTIRFSPATTYEPKNGYGYFIQNHEKTLDQHGEWYYNSRTKKLRMYFSGNPTAHVVKVSSVDNLVSCSNVDYITLQNLRIEGANKWGTYHSSVTGNSIKNCDIVFSGDMAVNAAKTGNINFTVEDSYISDAGNFGINCRFAGNNQIIRKNIIKNIGLFPGMGGVGTQHRTGFANNSGNNHLIESNIFDSIGYAGLKFGGNYTIVKNNVISNFTLTIDDAAGIYTGNQTGIPTVGRKIIGNIIFNGTGAIAGTTSAGIRPSSGIYTDDNSSGIEIIGNSVWNCGKAGLYLHNANNLTIRNNLFYDNDQAQIQLVQDNATYSPIRNIIFKNNICVSKTVDQKVAFFYTRLNDITNFGTLDSNSYARPLDDNLTITEITGLYTTNAVTSRHTLETWKKRYGKDPASVRSPKTFPATINLEDSVKFEYNATNADKIIALSGQYIDLKKKIYTNSVTLSPYSSILLIRTFGPTTNTPPTVSITSPKNDSNFIAPASITINATASDADGRIVKVDFYNGTTLLGTDSTSPYSFVWNNVPAGTYTLFAKAKDNGSLVTTSAGIVVNVSNVNVAPLVNITNPLEGQSFDAPATINIEATASDADGNIVKVDFYNGTTLLGSDSASPYSFTWNNVPVGTYTIIAIATDNGSQVTSSTGVVVNVSSTNVAPSVNITTPTAGNTFAAPASINIEATASDADGNIVKVDFYNGTTLLGSDSTSPYSFTWNNVPAGTYTVIAKATDNGSQVTSSTGVAITVYNPNGSPSVNITSPIAGDTFAAPATINIEATASDADGSIAKVDFYNGITLLGSDSTSPYSLTWNNVPVGTYTIIAIATDNGSLVSSPAEVTVSVNNPNVAPLINITNPIAGETFVAPATINIEATASDADGSIVKVDFYNGTTLLGSDNTSPYSFTWNNVPSGTYTLIAKAIDNGSLVTSSSGVAVTVYNANGAPSVNITNPIIGESFEAPATIIIEATASDADGNIVKVDFYNGTTLIGTDYTSPYSITWTGFAEESCSFTAKATDDKGLETISTAVTISMRNPIAPIINITNPQMNASYNAGESIQLAATASDADGTIAKVEFYNGSTLIGVVTSSPYTIPWDNVPIGEYIITAKATDNSGHETTSSIILITVNDPAAPNLNFQIAPNPTANILTIFCGWPSNNMDLRIFIYAVSGTLIKMIHTTSISNTIPLDVSNLKNGAYVLQVISADLLITKAFIKR